MRDAFDIYEDLVSEAAASASFDVGTALAEAEYYSESLYGMDFSDLLRVMGQSHDDFRRALLRKVAGGGLDNVRKRLGKRA